MDKRKIITVQQDVADILFDAQNKAYITGNSRMASGATNYEAGSKMQASEDEEESYQMKRSLTTYFTGLKSRLGEYLDEDTSTSNDLIPLTIEDNGVLKISFRLPANYNNASADALGSGIHAYLVDMIVADWFKLTNPGESGGYMEHGALMLEEVRAALYKRRRPKRPERRVFPPCDKPADAGV